MESILLGLLLLKLLQNVCRLPPCFGIWVSVLPCFSHTLFLNKFCDQALRVISWVVKEVYDQDLDSVLPLVCQQLESLEWVGVLLP